VNKKNRRLIIFL